MSRIEIAAELCKACEICMAVCPKDCIVHSDTLNRYGVYPARMRDGAECVGCAQCATMCPDAAIEVYRTAEEKGRGLSQSSRSENGTVPFIEKPQSQEAISWGGSCTATPGREKRGGSTTATPTEQSQEAAT